MRTTSVGLHKTAKISNKQLDDQQVDASRQNKYLSEILANPSNQTLFA